MKRSVIFVVLLVSYVGSNWNNSPLLRPILPIGEYKVYLKSILPCDPEARHKIQINFYMNKISQTEAQVAGNVTLEIPFDDTLKYHANFDQKMSNGGWATNVLKFIKDRGCSTFKSFFKAQSFKSLFGCNESCDCPIRPGIYMMNGMSANNMEKVFTNLPKVAYYGTYRFRMGYIKNNVEVGCSHTVVDVMRPWEKP